jgi:hypothetical protein
MSSEIKKHLLIYLKEYNAAKLLIDTSKNSDVKMSKYLKEIENYLHQYNSVKNSQIFASMDDVRLKTMFKIQNLLNASLNSLQEIL